MNTFTLFNILSNIFQYLPHLVDNNLVWIVRNLCANTLAMGMNSLIMQKLWLDLLHHPYKFVAIVRYISFKLALWTPLSILVVARLSHILDQFLRSLSSYGKFVLISFHGLKTMRQAFHKSLIVHCPTLCNFWVLKMENPNSPPLNLVP